jgi:hypothetical protein
MLRGRIGWLDLRLRIMCDSCRPAYRFAADEFDWNRRHYWLCSRHANWQMTIIPRLPRVDSKRR